MCASNARVVDVEQPVEAHVDAERHVDQVFVLLLQAVVHRRQAVDDVRHRELLAVLGQLVLLEGALGHAQLQQVHWGGGGGDVVNIIIVSSCVYTKNKCVA